MKPVEIYATNRGYKLRQQAISLDGLVIHFEEQVVALACDMIWWAFGRIFDL